MRRLPTCWALAKATVSRVLRLYRETGDVVPRPKGGGRLSPIRGKVATELKRLVAQKLDATVRELMAELTARTGIATSRPFMQRAMHRLGFSHKKRSFTACERDAPQTSGAAVSLRHY
ncbi:hypothetical protein HMI49_15210 [Corallococcus exercitus]|uniref:Transposase n=1 Tax=Corallococcus exercitus TaxID=2316736 RepID=A0A7Y4KIQ5_9BACT|nr:hypothetical protein [Corallococcus exercitus]NOK34548.1 hypothetical protein [Corallococcus exercitus]